MIERILYTAEASAEGGREGHARTSDGRLDVKLDVPTEMGGTGGPGTNPEQLFAVGYAACFQSSLLRLAAGRTLDLTGTRVTARVGIGPAREGGFGLAVALDLEAPGIDRAEAAELMARAHEICPYSRATRGNIDVTLAVAGVAIERAAAQFARLVAARLTMIDRHYGHLAHDGREHAIKLLDALNAPDLNAWTAVDAAWTPKPPAGVSAENESDD